ncbi:MAG TPA: ImmA/IrrE family metallo-endopeptidase [Candidatus Saccharimonadales bacterium]|nr:ImmA/IrrE family metallo-endopeptidase [Candidatus Saccharimonadales bacterium]
MEPLTQTAIINRAIGLKEAEGYIDVIKLAKSYDIEIYLQNKTGDENFNACIERDPDTNGYKIFVNPQQPFERQRFSIAHELAHYVLHKGMLDTGEPLHRDPTDQANKTNEEKADSLAAEILMPKKFVEEYTDTESINKQTPLTKTVIVSIANLFKVSRTVAAIRLRSLNYFVPFISFA